MADLVQRVDNALNESRTLVLVGQVLFAYSFEAVFEKSFADLPQGVRSTELVGATLVLIAIALLMSPAPFHCIVERGNDCEGYHEYVTRVVDIALPIFGAAMTLEFYALSYRIVGPEGALGLAALVAAAALAFWEGLELREKHRRRHDGH